MKDITLIILDSECDVATVNTTDNSFFEPVKSVSRQLESHGISFNALRTSIDAIPNCVESSLVMFIESSFLLKEDYIFNAITLNNLHRDMGIVFGPTEAYTKSSKNVESINNSYHSYDLNFGSIYTADITDEPHNYGSLYNAVISGSIYNRIGFSACKTPRSYILDNPGFLSEIAKISKVYYSSVLRKTKVLNEKDFDHEIISDYYYNLGYIDGVSHARLSKKEKIDDLWKKFVEAPEVIDSNHPRWLFQHSKIENITYLELLVLLKCKYQIGYFEGMLGKKVI